MAKNGKFKLGIWVILIIAIVLGLILSFINFLVLNPSKEYVSTNIELLYDGAAEGLAPNGQPFSIEGIRDEALLTTAIEESNLTGVVSAEELSQNMMVRGSYPANIIDQIKSVKSLFAADPTREVGVDEYYPTAYTVSIYNSFRNKLSEAQLKSLLSSVISGYKQYYADKYSSGIDWEPLNGIWKTDAYDYSQAVTTLSLRLDMIKKYAKELYESEPTFALPDGSTFSSLMLRADTIMSNDIQSLSANITINALSKDVVRLRSQYNYEIEQLNYRLGGLETELENINTLIEEYDIDSDIYYNSGDGVVMVEGNSKETYEKLVEKKNDITNEISSIQISIGDYQSKISDLDAKTDDDSEASYTERMEAAIEAAGKKIDELSANFDAMVKAYNEEYVRRSDVSDSGVRYIASKVVSKSFIKAIIKSEAPLCAVALILIAAVGLVSELRTSRRRRS